MLNLSLQMEHQVYQVDQVGFFYEMHRICFDQWSSFVGDKGEPGLPGPGFPGKKMLLFYIKNLKTMIIILGTPGPVGAPGDRGYPGMIFIS
jgi:hypothetical protein